MQHPAEGKVSQVVTKWSQLRGRTKVQALKQAQETNPFPPYSNPL